MLHEYFYIYQEYLYSLLSMVWYLSSSSYPECFYSYSLGQCQQNCFSLCISFCFLVDLKDIQRWNTWEWVDEWVWNWEWKVSRMNIESDVDVDADTDADRQIQTIIIGMAFPGICQQPRTRVRNAISPTSIHYTTLHYITHYITSYLHKIVNLCTPLVCCSTMHFPYSK